MAKVIVDRGLADVIRSLRIQNSIAAKDLAIELGKSRSYVSKLENGSIQTIDSDELEKCLRFISHENEIDEVLEQVYKTVSIKFSRDEIENMLWLDNFDAVDRRIPIPEGFASTYSKLLLDHDITIERLTEAINSNVFIPEGILNNKDIPENEWFRFGNDTYIKMNITVDRIQSILSGKEQKSNYVVLLAIVLYSIYLFDPGKYNELDVTKINEINIVARDVLEQYNVYTLGRKAEFIERAADYHELFDRLTLHEKENAEVISKFNPLLYLFSYYDVEAANRLITEFTKNMEWDAPFIMEIAGLPFYKLEHCSFRLKKELIENIKELLKRAMELPEAEKKREQY